MLFKVLQDNNNSPTYELFTSNDESTFNNIVMETINIPEHHLHNTPVNSINHKYLFYKKHLFQLYVFNVHYIAQVIATASSVTHSKQ